MKLITAGVTSAVLVAGLAGSVAAYRSQTGGLEPEPRPVAEQSDASLEAEPQQPEVRWAPCPGASRLERGACVTDVVRTVVVPGADRSREDESGDDELGDDDSGRDDAEHGDDDHGDDDHGDDDHGDDDDHEDDDDHDDDHDEGDDD
jgi:hypothetical protein